MSDPCDKIQIAAEQLLEENASLKMELDGCMKYHIASYAVIEKDRDLHKSASEELVQALDLIVCSLIDMRTSKDFDTGNIGNYLENTHKRAKEAIAKYRRSVSELSDQQRLAREGQ